MKHDLSLIAEDIPLACSLTADERAVRGAEINDLFAGIQQVQALDDGYALCFPGSDPWLQKVLSFIEGERSCCPFFTFELAFLPNHGPLWLYIRGPAGVKEVIRAMGSGRGITPA